MSNSMFRQIKTSGDNATVEETEARDIELPREFYKHAVPSNPQPYAVVTVCAKDDTSITIRTEELAASSSSKDAIMPVNPKNVDAMVRLIDDLSFIEKGAYNNDCADRERMSAARYQARLTALGCKISNLLFGSPDNQLFRILKRLLDCSKGQNGYIRIVLDLAPGELNRLPWEYALGPDDYPLGVHPRLTVVRMPNCHSEKSMPINDVELPYDIAIICTEEKNETFMRRKAAEIYETLNDSNANMRINHNHSDHFVASRPLDIFYYIGHGSAEKVTWDSGKDEEPIKANELIKLVSQDKKIGAPRLSVLLTCAGPNYALGGIDENGMRYADALVMSGAPAVIAVFGALDVNVAPLLVNYLHRDMFTGYPLDWVLQKVRRDIYNLQMSEQGDVHEANNWYRLVLSAASPQALDMLAGYGTASVESALKQPLADDTARSAALWRKARDVVFHGVSRDSMPARIKALKPLVENSALAGKLKKVSSSLENPDKWSDTLEAWRDLKWSVAAEAVARGGLFD